ncbi:MAG: hypothetical protein CVU51_00115 [Deltaproteobacteria bacterium HGW-Deltaproteobacteria-1]|jgi:hypothetical protein|nr:MAG: hypothetical protein CVU51_00115 [Deltaproteobacteria bacterium HGW-Deltaproteobacteria-1]
MNQQQMTRETIEFDNPLPDTAFSTINTIWDQSAKIFSAIIGNANLLPDDGGNETDNGIPAYKKKREAPRLSNKELARLKKIKLTCLQEEHALWLK